MHDATPCEIALSFHYPIIIIKLITSETTKKESAKEHKCDRKITSTLRGFRLHRPAPSQLLSVINVQEK